MDESQVSLPINKVRAESSDGPVPCLSEPLTSAWDYQAFLVKSSTHPQRLNLSGAQIDGLERGKDPQIGQRSVVVPGLGKSAEAGSSEVSMHVRE